MKKYRTGFFMAWGMFLSIPCPSKKWDEDCRSEMLTCFPMVGLVVGAVWALAYFLLGLVLPQPACALVLCILPWLCTGFMHLDGYMDCCDAILSRRDLDTKQKILKDSHCGAFAIIGMVLLGLCQWSVCFCADKDQMLFAPLILIPVATRAAAVVAIHRFSPMPQSEYAKMEHTGKELATALAVLAFATVLSFVLVGYYYGMSLRSAAPLFAAAAYFLFAAYGKKQLGGMNGDVSGFALSLGELVGLAVLCMV